VNESVSLKYDIIRGPQLEYASSYKYESLHNGTYLTLKAP